ncbi:hypothetical protein FOZ61_007965 [Perkinsus olseni]|uniref:Uncharacterized protein n=1 Tax=Perkinsus olseni TaxID=32597 RepID=A0A7J6L6T8_PEROL|nr:hypothetical protein FOZ61_007965 [Perkinsus olseni]KAF4657912.1 hypothetical protein FOL46_007173 [Perkinsus olseni]
MIGSSAWAPAEPGSGSPHRLPPRWPWASSGHYSLERIENNIYHVDFGRSARTCYGNIAWQLKEAGVAKADEPLAGIQDRDLATLHYTTGDSFTTNSRNEEIEFIRVAHSLTPGVFEYAEPEAPHLKLRYQVRSDGVVGISAECGGVRTPRLLFKLAPRDQGMQYTYYAVEPLGLGTLSHIRNKMQSACPNKNWKDFDLSQVVFATDKTMYVAVGRSSLALTKTN